MIPRVDLVFSGLRSTTGGGYPLRKAVGAALKSETGSRLWNAFAFGVAILRVAATYFSSFTFLERFVSLGSWELLAMVAYILFFTTVMFLFTVVQHFLTNRKEKYANVTTRVHAVSHKARNLVTLIEKQSAQVSPEPDKSVVLDMMRRDLQPLLDDVSQTFSMLTGTKCRAAIKVVATVESDKLYLETLSRDSHSAQACAERDARRSKERSDPLKKNPDLLAIFSDTDPTWHALHNDLPRVKDYKTTSFQAYDAGYGDSSRGGNFWERLTGDSWPLPYRSTLVCAIRHPHVPGINEKPEIVGFLCVDSESRNVFSKRWDVELCFAFADALFHPIDRLLRLGTR